MKKALLIYLFLQLMSGWALAQVYHVGDLFTAEDGSQGIVYYTFPDGSGWVVALQDCPPAPLLPGSNAPDIPNLPNHTGVQALLQDTAGYSNTQIIREYVGTGTQCGINNIDFEHGWYLPAAAQLLMLYAQLPFIETALLAAGGSTLDTTLFYSSTESGVAEWYAVDFFWGVNFSPAAVPDYYYNVSAGNFTSIYAIVTSEMSHYASYQLYPVRAVRSFPPPENIYDTTLSYSWNTGSTEPHFSDVPLQTTNYTVTVSNAYGCTNSASVEVMVLDNEPQTYYDTICQGATYNSYGFSLSAEETGSILDTTLFRIASAAGCESEITVYLTLLPPDVVEIEEQGGQSFVWNGITYTEEGTYTQYFNNIHGCDSTVIMTLTLDGTEPDTTADEETEPNVLYLPNAFTPNEDGKNSVFLPVFTNPDEIEEYRMEIYNRWGGLVFRTEEITFGWDGSNAMEGVYAVMVHYTSRGAKPKTVKGSVTLIR
jgi:gliding motility-associated-like protein